MEKMNEVFSTLSMRRRYEVWFQRLGLADNSGAWWFRYLLMNPGRGGCRSNAQGMPVQIWATWFPNGGKPTTFTEQFDATMLAMSGKGRTPFHFAVANNNIDQDSCRGSLDVDGHTIKWDLQYRSTFHVTLSDKGWIGFSRTPHSDAIFSGHIDFDGHEFVGSPLGFGVQGHNCGYRHRNFWRWMHAYFPGADRPASTLEALAYEMPFGLVFRKAVLWHGEEKHILRNFRETAGKNSEMQWNFSGSDEEIRILACIDGHGTSVHRLSYVKTDCSGTFPVVNNSFASASVVVQDRLGSTEKLETNGGAVLEIAG